MGGWLVQATVKEASHIEVILVGCCVCDSHVSHTPHDLMKIEMHEMEDGKEMHEIEWDERSINASMLNAK